MAHELARRMEKRRQNVERYLHLLHRVTGIYLLVFVYFHVALVSLRMDPSLLLLLYGSLSNPVMLSFVVAILFHGLNGIRLLLAELGLIVGRPRLPVFPYEATSLGKGQKITIALTLSAFLVLSVIALLEFM